MRLILLLIIIFPTAAAFAQASIESDYGYSTQLDDGSISFYSINSNERAVISVDQSGRTTILFSDGDFILIRPLQGDAIFWTDGIVTAGSLTEIRHPNMSNINEETLFKLVHHLEFGLPSQRNCPPHVPPSIGCNEDSIQPFSSEFNLYNAASSTSAFCQSVYRNQSRPFDGNRTLGGCAALSIATAATTAIASVTACVGSMFTRVGWFIETTCGAGLGVSLVSSAYAVERVNYCQASYDETIANVIACDTEAGNEPGGSGGGNGSPPLNPDISDGDRFDLAAYGYSETCVVVRTGSEGSMVRQIVCFPN